MKKVLIIILIVLALFAVVGTYFYTQNATKTSSEMMPDGLEEKSMITGNDKMSETDADAKKKTRYIVYAKDSLSESLDTKRVLFFYASWCPTCRPVDAELKTNESQIPSDTTVIRVNYNDPETDQSEKSLAQKYGVTYQHTFVQIDKNGNEIRKWNGGGIEELLENIVQ